MANSNFVVQNGLSVGNLTIFAGNGDITTTGNISTIGGSFGGLNPASIFNGSSNVSVSANNIFANISNTNVVNISSTGQTVNGTLVTGVINAATIGNVGATYIGSNISNPVTLTSTGTTSSYGQLNVGGPINYGPDYGLVASFVSNIPGYNYVAVQNLSNTGNASASFTAYNNTGTSFIDVGVNSSGFNAGASGFVNNSLNTAGASYAYSQGGDLVVGTWNNNGIHFITNAVTTAGDSMFIAGNGNVYISGNLTVSGNTTQINTITSFTTETANVVQTAYLQGNSSINSGSITLQNNFIGTGAWQSAVVGPTYGGTGVNNGSYTVTLGASVNLNQNLRTTDAPTFAGITTSSTIVPSSNASINIGSTSAWFATIYGTSTHALYADLAENYVADRSYMPGTVLMFGGTNEVTQADADTTRVAGIVSTNPAHLMNGGLQGGNIVPLALMGRVPCMVIGPVAKGDLMISAGWGYAKTNNAAGVGQVIGKALEDFPMQAKGVIEVVVGRV